MSVKIHESWIPHLSSDFESKYFQNLTGIVKKEYQTKKVFPPAKHIFRAFDLCPFDRVKVVIIGQDPYHGSGQANGLCFAVNDGVALPPSLKNIFKEIESDTGVKPIDSGDLLRWAKQGVLLLNSTLTVLENSPGSHQGLGWEQFTTSTIRALSQNRNNLVFLLWGNYAKQKGSIIDRVKHLVLESAHPSPFSAHSGFMGNKHFSKANDYLKTHSLEPIDWR
jgi:uracil-DNA glycosylase